MPSGQEDEPRDINATLAAYPARAIYRLSFAINSGQVDRTFARDGADDLRHGIPNRIPVFLCFSLGASGLATRGPSCLAHSTAARRSRFIREQLPN
jgi:hypothetical protein